MKESLPYLVLLLMAALLTLHIVRAKMGKKILIEYLKNNNITYIDVRYVSTPSRLKAYIAAVFSGYRLTYEVITKDYKVKYYYVGSWLFGLFDTKVKEIPE